MIEFLIFGAIGGIAAGMLGIGGGSLFVPGLLMLGLTHVEAEATSLLAILPVALVGAWRQHGYGNLRPKTAVLIGAGALPAAAVGVALVNFIPERAAKIGLAAAFLYIAWQMARRALRPPDKEQRAHAACP